MKSIGKNMEMMNNMKRKEVYILQQLYNNDDIHDKFIKSDQSCLMFFSPIHHSIIDESEVMEEIFKKTFNPNIVWLLFEL
jgi:hypothetical protein